MSSLRIPRRLKWRKQYMLVAALVIFGSFMISAPYADAAIGLRSSAIGDNGSGAGSITISKPTGVAEGDLMVVVVATRSTGTLSGNTFSWAEVPNSPQNSGTTIRQFVKYRVATASEPSTYTFDITIPGGGTPRMTGVIAAYTGVDTTSPINVENGQANASSTAINPPSVTTTVAGTRVLVLGSTARSDTLTANGSYTMVNQATSSGGGGATAKVTSGVMDLTQSTPGPTGTTGLSAGSAEVNIGHVVALNPELSTLTQQKYRWYANTNSVQPGAALAAEDATTSVTAGTIVRLRNQLSVSGVDLAATSQAFKLQYSTNTSGPWTDVASSGWWNSSWGARRKITLNNSASAVNLTNFPIRVSLSSSNIDYAKTQNSGQDIRFVDPDGTELKYEIEKWDEAGTSEVWVKVPQIDANSTTDHVWMYYDNSGASDAQDATNVWSNGYKAVWHNKEPSGTSIADSTGNGSTGSLQNGASITAGGKVGNASDYDGSDDTMFIAANSNINNLYSQGGGGMTVSVWANVVDNNAARKVIMTKAADSFPTTGWTFDTAQGTDVARFAITEDPAYIVRTTNSITPNYGTWSNYAFTYNGSVDASGANTYINGALSNGGGGGSLTSLDSDAAADLYIGCDVNEVTVCIDAQIDEVRLSNVVRSADWVEAEYISTNNAMNSFGSEEMYSVVTFSGYDNATPADGATISSSLLTGTDTLESYEEFNPTAGNPNVITAGDQGEWDFVIDTSGASPNTYYFRMVKSDGTALDSYSVYPTLTITSSGPTLQQQTRGGQSVINGVKTPFSF